MSTDGVYPNWPFEKSKFKKFPEEHIAVVTMDYPEKLNPMTANTDLMDGVRAAVDDVNRDPNMKVLIVEGAGGSFSSGADVGHVGHQYRGWETPQPGRRSYTPPIRERL